MEKPKGKRRLQKEATREQIITAAIRVYGERGFSVPVSVIAKSAGLAHGSIFVHFKTKEDLLHCAAERFFREVDERMRALVSTHGDFETMLKEFLSIVVEHEPFYLRVITETDTLPPHTAAGLLAMRATNARYFEAAVKREIRQGRIRALSPRMMFGAWRGLVYYYLHEGALLPPGESALRRHKNELAEFFISLIKSRASEECDE